MKFANYKILTFKQQLFALFVFSIFFIALILSVVASWMSNKQFRQSTVNSGLQHAKNAALHSQLALLYKSGDNAIDAANSILAFPDINHVAIINKDLSVLYEAGDQITMHTLSREDVSSLHKAIMLHEDKLEWHFVAPVYVKKDTTFSDIEIGEDNDKQKDLLGYVYLAANKSRLIETEKQTLITNLVIGVIIGVLVLIVLYELLQHFLSPLNKLAEVMTRSVHNELANYTGDKGPAETREISDAYNRLVNAILVRDKEIHEYQNSLEKKIEIRTREIIKAKDEAVRANKYKTEFLSNTTHELRTPLQAIIGYTEAAMEVALEEGIDDIGEDLDGIEKNSRHLLSLINSILDIAKIESGKMDVHYEYINVSELMSELEMTVKPLMAKSNNDFQIDIKLDNEPLFTDRTKLYQILLNLSANAAKFTENGRVILSVEKEQDNLVIHIEDNGIGIAEDKQELIFEAFHQSDGSVVRQYGGTGLGLSLTKQFSELLGGNITLKSKVGEGSVFTVSLPLFTKQAVRQSI